MTISADDHRVPLVPHRNDVIYLFAAFVSVFLLWAVTMPLFAAPDEQWHMVNAQGYARLDLTNPFTTDGIPVDAGSCYQFFPTITASCMELAWETPGTEVISRATDYPPVSHLIAAVPATVVDGVSGAYVMRLWMAAVVAGIFTWAGALYLSSISNRRHGIAALTLATTPMVAFMSGAVSPSGLTAAAASLGVAACLHVRAVGLRHVNTWGLLVASALVVGSRRDGFVWAAVMSISLIPFVWGAVRVSWRRHGLRAKLTAAVAAVALGGLAGRRLVEYGVDFVQRHSVDVSGLRLEARGSFLELTYLRDLIGRFGWLDTRLPNVVYWLVIIAVFVWVASRWMEANAPERWAAGLSIVAIFCAPLIIGIFRSPYMQGRYLFPVWCTAMLVLGATSVQHRTTRWHRVLGIPVVLVWPAVHVVSWYVTLRRHTVGIDGPLVFWRWEDWSPPVIGIAGALLCATMTATIVAWALFSLARRVPNGCEPRRSSLHCRDAD